jgi:NAD+ synthase (glutamine-hydrolysing)
MKIALGQIDTVVGDIDGNVRRVLDACARARTDGANMIVLPELVVCGYPPRDLLNIAEFRAKCDEGVDRIVAGLPEGLFAIFGAPRTRPRTLPVGRSLWNAAIVAERGSILAEIPKALLPTYDVFDERRYFEPAEEHAVRVVELAGTKVGVVICEDMWNDRLFWGDRRIYDRDPVAEAVEQGAAMIVNVSASPFADRKFEIRRAFVAHAAKRWRVPFVYVNASGGNDGILFDGHSLAFSPEGEAIAELPFFEEQVRTVDLTARVALPEVDTADVLHRALVTGVGGDARHTGGE